MKKRGFLIYLILGILFLPGITFAKSYSGNAGAGRSAVMDTSLNYYYTAWTSLNTNSLNVIPVPYSGGDYYLMGSEYSFAVTMTGDTYFSGHVTIPVAANTIYNYTLTNGLSDTDMRFGIDQNFGVYNVNAIINSANWYCNVYPHLGVAHTYCYYDIYFHFSLPEALNGAYNLNVAVLNLASNRSAYYFSGYDSNGCAIEFPMAASNSGYPDMRAYMDMSSSGGQSGSPDNTEEILNGVSEAADSINDTIQESYENLVKSQEVCRSIDKSSIVLDNTLLYTDGSTDSNNSYGLTDYISTNGSTITVTYDTPSSTALCFYNVNKTLISCIASNTLSVNDILTIPNNSSFVRFTIRKDWDRPQFSYCQNGNQAISNQLDGLLDQSTDGIDFTFGDIDVISDTPVSDLLLLPLELITKITTSLGSGCMTWDLPFNLWGNDNYVLHMPCIDPEDYFGSSVWMIIDDLFCIFMIYNIFKMLLRFFESWSSLNDTFDDVVGGVR